MSSCRCLTRARRQCNGAWLAIALALPVSVAAADWSASVGVTSDYMWRGSSQTDTRPALQAGVKWAAQSGFYASAWGSSVRFDADRDAHAEFDLAAGWSGAVGSDWKMDVSLLRYVYPGSRLDLDWTELNAVASWRERAWVGVGWSDDAMAGGHAGTYVNAGLRMPVNARMHFDLGLARYILNDGGDDYSHAWLSAVYAPTPRYELRLTAHATDGGARRRFGSDLADSRLEAAVQASF